MELRGRALPFPLAGIRLYSSRVRPSTSKHFWTSVENGFFVCVFLAGVIGSPAWAQNAGPTHASGDHSSISQPIFPLTQVHAGLHGTAYTVFEGSTPEPIEVEILGVLRDAIGPGKDMILVRLRGARVEDIGVAAGMSGSPVYVDGKLAGAIAYRIGQFTKEPIAGVTPIQQMLEVVTASQENKEDFDSPGLPSSAASIPSPFGIGAMRPIETPLVFNGFSPAAIQIFKEHFASSDLVPVSGLGGASPEEKDPAPVVAGSAISAIIVSGDFNMAATCTVTYVDPRRLLACGHPITHFGDISLPMTKAVVVTTIASQLEPMKIVNTTQTVGSFTQDRASGILGVFGKPARMVPVTLTIRGIPQPHTYHFSVIDHPRLTSATLMSSVYQAMEDTNGSSDPSTYDLTGEIVLAGHPAVRIDQWIAATRAEPVSQAAAVVIGQRFESIYGNPRELPDIRNVTLTVEAFPGRRSATLADARVLNSTVHAGDEVTVETVLHPYRLPQRVVRMSVRLPETVTPGPVRLLVSDGNTLDHTLHLIPNPAAPAPGLGETIARLNELHATDKLYVTLLAPVPQANLSGLALPAVPLTMANVLQPQEENARFSIDGETAVPLGSKGLDLALSGSHVITLNVQP